MAKQNKQKERTSTFFIKAISENSQHLRFIYVPKGHERFKQGDMVLVQLINANELKQSLAVGDKKEEDIETLSTALKQLENTMEELD